VHLQETLHRLKQERERWVALLGVEPTDIELADLLGIPTKKVQLLRSVDQEAISLDISIGSAGDTVLGDLIPDLTRYEPSQLADRHACQAALQSLLSKLSDRERRVITLRFGLIDGEERTLESIGREYGLTRERIRQIEVKALKQLQHPRVKRFLQDFLA
jgi:RNA polymerase primary sigma factor